MGIAFELICWFDTISLLSNPELSSNSLEYKILRSLAERHKDDPRFKYFVHDKDTKAYKLIHDEIGWNLEKRLDSTHTTKAWKRMFEKRKMLTESDFEFRFLKSRKSCFIYFFQKI